MAKIRSSKTNSQESLEPQAAEESTVTVETAEVIEESQCKPASRLVYRAVYTISYGVVFGALIAAKLLVPKGSVIENGLRDGAQAAVDRVREREASKAIIPYEDPAPQEDVSSGGFDIAGDPVPA